MVLEYNIIILWDHHRICGPSLAETSFCDAYLYCMGFPVAAGSRLHPTFLTHHLSHDGTDRVQEGRVQTGAFSTRS